MHVSLVALVFGETAALFAEQFVMVLAEQLLSMKVWAVCVRSIPDPLGSQSQLLLVT